MALLLRQNVEAAALGEHPAGHLGRDRFAFAFALDRPARHHGLLAVTTFVAFLAFVLGVGNRFTSSPLFVYIPEVSLIQPLGRAAWQQAFALHQQGALFALCGGYQASGMEPLAAYQLLYTWEWLRVGSLLMLAACGGLLGVLALREFAADMTRAVAGDTGRIPMPRPAGAEMLCLVGLAGLAAAYLPLRYFADHAGLFAAINIGQHRHALDVTFASLALAFLLCAIISSGRDAHGSQQRRLSGAAWTFFLAFDIAFGALLEATDGAVVWSTFPGYADGLLPSADRLFALSPAWRNVTENVYLIQASHRVLSLGLWLVALMALAVAAWRRERLTWPALLFGLVTLEAALGAATLVFGVPPAVSIVHQLGAVLALAVALMPAMAAGPRGPRVISLYPPRCQV
jgi:cytochrome c oxidase assembly protein subunit 15